MRRELVEAHHAASDAQAALPAAVLARHGIDSEQHHAMVDQLARSGSHLHRASLWWVTADMASVAREDREPDQPLHDLPPVHRSAAWGISRTQPRSAWVAPSTPGGGKE
jgi:hypothetical protein